MRRKPKTKPKFKVGDAVYLCKDFPYNLNANLREVYIVKGCFPGNHTDYRYHNTPIWWFELGTFNCPSTHLRKFKGNKKTVAILFDK